MALSSTRLSSELKPVIESNIRNYILGGDSTPYPSLTQFCAALADAISQKVISEIVTNAEIKNAFANGTLSGTVSGDTVSLSINSSNHTITGGIE